MPTTICSNLLHSTVSADNPPFTHEGRRRWPKQPALTRRVALVTGAARGIGFGIAKALREAGAQVALADLADSHPTTTNYALSSQSQLGQASASLGASDAALPVAVDVTDADSCAAAVAQTIEHFGQLDILVNNAGIVSSGPLSTFAEQDWDRVFAVNCKGLFLMTQAALEPLRQSPNGCVINTASIAGKKGYRNMSAYCGSKFAAIGITQALAAELAPDNIRVNALCPGVVGTSMWLEHLLPSNSETTLERAEEFDAMMTQTVPLGRPQTVEDMGAAAVYLASAANVTGVALNVDGRLGDGLVSGWYKDPVWAFLIIGALLLGISKLSGEDDETAAIIEVGEQDIARLTAQWQAQMRRAPTETELDNLIDAFVREEAYYREAKRLGTGR